MAITGSQLAQLMAQGGVMRGATSRGNVHSRQTFVSIAGVHYAAGKAAGLPRVKYESLTITEREGETPNTAQFQVTGFIPVDGQEVIITQGSKNNLDRQFAGTIMTDATAYIDTPTTSEDTVSAVDYTWQLTRGTITQRWQSASATVIAQAIIAHAGRGFTSLSVVAGLPMLDEFTVTNKTHAQALSNLAERIGGYWDATYRSTVVEARADVRFGITTDTSETDPTTVTAASALLTEMTDLVVTRDDSQVMTRQAVEGGGSTALARCELGETIIPVAQAHWYNPSGGTVRSGPQTIGYAGVQLGGGGSVVGPAVAPVTKPSVFLMPGGSLTLGAHQWAYTWVTAGGETLPSPLSVSLTAQNYTPPTPGAFSVYTASEMATATATIVIGNTYAYKQVYINATGAAISLQSPASVPVTAVASASNPAVASPIHIAIDTGATNADPLIAQILFYRSENGGTFDPAGWAYVGGNEHWDIGSNAGTAYAGSASALHQTANMTGVARGPTGTTTRKLYQTEAGGSQLKLQQTIANNTATTATATLADGSLGANAPTSDTSGLSTVAGQVNAGSTSILTASAGPFSDTGGWAISGQQVIRYGSIIGNTLTDVPASGSGAIVSVLQYGDPLDPAPALTGITGHALTTGVEPASIVASAFDDDVTFTFDGPHGLSVGDTVVVANAKEPNFNRSFLVTELFGPTTFMTPNYDIGTESATVGAPLTVSTGDQILYTIHPGDPVNLRVVIDDLSAQAALAARMLPTVDDGVIEGTVIQDGRITEIEARARGAAVLALRSLNAITLAYNTKDKNTRAGRTAGWNVGAPQSVVGSFKVLSVTVSGYAPSVWPNRKATVSNSLFTLADLLRKARGGA